MIDAKCLNQISAKKDNLLYLTGFIPKIQDCCNLRLLIKFDIQVWPNLLQIKNRRESL